MRIRRIHLTSYRGVGDRTIEIPETGVTVVVGPNEVGKSSLAEALDLLFFELDSSKKRGVRAVQPVHRDEGTEIEAEVTCGPYAFTYWKRFHKKPATRLTVTRPAPESLTGREAHERVVTILEETVDIALWRALRIQQGEELAQPDLGAGTSLAAALDRAAGQTQADDDAESLFDAARAEYERYFTATGRPKKDADELDREVTELEAELAAIEEQLRGIERDARESDELVRRAADLERQIIDLERAAIAAEARWADVRRESERVQQLALAAQLAAARAAETSQRAGDRETLRAELAACAARLGELASTQSANAGPLATAEEEARHAVERASAARAADEEVRRIAELRQRDLEFRRAELDHQQLSERLARVRAADDAAQAADDLLASNRATEETVAAVRTAALEVERAAARLEAGSAQVRVEALRDVDVATGDGAPRRVAAGDAVEDAVTEELRLTIADVARITVTPGQGAEGLTAARETARAELRAALERAGAEDVAGAAAAHAARAEAERTLAARRRVHEDDLRDLTLDQLARKATSTESVARAYLSERVATPEPAPDFDTAQTAAREAAEARAAAAAALREAEARRGACEEQLRTLREKNIDVSATVRVSQAELARQTGALEAARDAASDAELIEQRAAAARAAAEADAQRTQASEALTRSEPELVERAAAGARTAVDSARGDLRGVEERQIALRARLEQAGESGLAERRGAVEAQLARARDAAAARARRAAAVERLFTTLRERRDTARRAYVKPLATRVDQLGRFVFGADFEVTLDDDLQVVSRTLGGRTVPFGDLSGGAREQLSLLLRLAAAQTVADDGGVPLLLDDALGYSDPGRLAAMGAVLDRAGETMQVIVLTCLPERYRHVSRRHEIRLDTDAS